MRINILQHAADEGPGAIATWAQIHQGVTYVYHPAVYDILPRAEQTDLLVLMGGSVSPSDKLGWIAEERALIKQMIASGKPILGICFGAEQIVETLAGHVDKMPDKRIGWTEFKRANDLIPGLPEKVTALSWHQKMFSKPVGAKTLFAGEKVPTAGFLYQDNVVGLQFHLEVNENNLRDMVVNNGGKADVDNELGQTSQQILHHGVPRGNARVLFNILNYITGQESLL
ncbi:MAG: type 1 glutamine amidotransferase [Lactobacillus sp.]